MKRSANVMPAGSRPVFVLGAPRSGTTGVARALGHHPNLWAGAETKFLHELFGTRLANLWERERQRSTPSWLAREGVAREEFLGAVALGIDALFSSRSAGRRWIDHTPQNTLAAGALAEAFPSAQFVLLVRDGRRVVQSMIHFSDKFRGPDRDRVMGELPPFTGDFRRACIAWRDMVAAGLRFAGDQPERCLTVRTEELATDPHAGFARVLEFLGERIDPGPADHFATTVHNSSFPTGGAERPSPWDEWDEEQRQVFSDVAGPLMEALGMASGEELAGGGAPSRQP